MSASEPSPTHTTSSLEDLENMLNGEFSDEDDRGRSGGWTRRILLGASLGAVALCIVAAVHALSTGPKRPLAYSDGVPAAHMMPPTWSVPEPDEAEPDTTSSPEASELEPEESGAGEAHGGPGPVSEKETYSTWYAECVDHGWPDVEEHCGSCTARVTHAKYNHTCDSYCTSIGQYCAGAWEPSGDGCDTAKTMTCSEALTSTNAAVCQCVKTEQRAACAPHRGNCLEAKCCASITDSCFEKNDGWYGCRSSCAPGKPDHMDGPEWQQPWTCKQPHSRPEAKMRETHEWPDIVAVCSTGEVLVEPHAFAETYKSDCGDYCRNGAARDAPGAEHWISMVGKGKNETQTCPGDYNGTRNWGVFCSCSFPDRL